MSKAPVARWRHANSAGLQVCRKSGFGVAKFALCAYPCLLKRQISRLHFRGSWQTLGMRIVVCVKHVPDADSDRRIEDGRLVRGEDDILNELDENAVEAAVSLVETFGGEVVAVTMGPQDAEDALTRALQLGADRGILIDDEALRGADAVGTARLLAHAVEILAAEETVDLVITGMASLDGMTSMVAPGIARSLDWPLLDLADRLEVEAVDGSILVRTSRRADGSEEELAATAPAVVSVTDQINEPRYPSFKDLRAARSKPLDTWGRSELEAAGIDLATDTVNATEVVAASPRVREVGTIITDSGEGGTALAEFLVTKLGE